MSQNPQTIAKLNRKVARLEARLMELEAQLDNHRAAGREHIYGVVDAEMRIKQAIAILTGNDE